MLVARHHAPTDSMLRFCSAGPIDAALLRSACSEGADPRAHRRLGLGAAPAGADSKTACALLPPRPNELTPPSTPCPGSSCGVPVSRSPCASSRNPGWRCRRTPSVAARDGAAPGTP